jgi:hypothetical protein
MVWVLFLTIVFPQLFLTFIITKRGLHHNEKTMVRSEEQLNSWYGYIYWHEQIYHKTSMVIGFVIIIPSITPIILLMMIMLIFTTAIMQPLCCPYDINDHYYNACGMPAGHFLPVRGMILGVFEDLPQLAVQLWVFSTKKQGSKEFSTGSLLFAFGMTLLNILH